MTETDDRILRLALPETLAALDTPAFAETLQRELAAQADRLPLQEALQHTDRALTDGIRIVPLRVEKGEREVRIRVGVFYQGILAGSCCADDPTPVEPELEYCELTLSCRTDGVSFGSWTGSTNSSGPMTG